MKRVGVVGAGLVGLAVARRIAQTTGAEVTVFEKEDVICKHQSGHNSGVVHSGIYYKPGSLKATLCRRGVELIKEFTAEHGLEYRELGKVIVARDEVEVTRLRDLQDRAAGNGVPGVRWLGPEELRELEPHVTGLAALHSPTTAIVDYPAIAHALVDDLTKFGGSVRLNAPVDGVERSAGGVAVTSRGERDEFDRLVLCAGLQSDSVARLAGDDPGPAIVPFRGEYYRLVPDRRHLVNGLVYPVPDPAYPFLGVHLTPRIDGTVDVGPNAVLAMAREGYKRTDIRPADLLRTLAWPGSLRLFRQHWRMGVHEYRGSFSKRAFTAAARAYVPELAPADLVAAPAGVRAQAVDRDGSLVDDFRISALGPVTAVRNAPSPAATSSLAIAEYVVDHITAK
ncbi:L-2-hydroxyglutarate oxidase [Actinospica sp. MGRD01-02]|uniref:L-2-hydroxyglutarate oxidase n=1 Tax=Actinospica acidithermotolerans TaxID=2828514 RepID=A0A941IMB0_9ACTN|nr:L-2-hydroxyglutarate oxidase [Actinospica acidithermotolerans]MBR7828401.1 L-2-hydroxyglutarate oxidase [Actinospica acidithermotolerans]